MSSDDVRARMEADVKRLEESGGDIQRCAFDAATAIPLARAIFIAGPNVRLLTVDGLDEAGKRTRYLGVNNPDISTTEWFNVSHLCPPEPPENCEEK